MDSSGSPNRDMHLVYVVTGALAGAFLGSLLYSYTRWVEGNTLWSVNQRIINSSILPNESES